MRSRRYRYEFVYGNMNGYTNGHGILYIGTSDGAGLLGDGTGDGDRYRNGNGLGDGYGSGYGGNTCTLHGLPHGYVRNREALAASDTAMIAGNYAVAMDLLARGI